METINSNDKAPSVRSTINTNFSSLGSGFESIYSYDQAPELIRKLNSNFAIAAQQGGGGSGETVVVDGAINVKTDFHAVGDGTTDDTVALENAFAAAYEGNRPVYIPSGEYLIRRPLTLRSGMEVYGDGNSSIIRKKAAVWYNVTVDMAVGDTTVTLSSTDGLSVGDGMFILDKDTKTASSRYYTHGVITAINGNQVTFVSSMNNTSTAGSGAIKAHKSGSTLSTSYAILRGWSKWECCNVIIHDLCLDGNRQTSEPMSWCNGCIHFEPYSDSGSSFSNVSYNTRSYNHVIVNCKIINSSFDAISDQGEGSLIVKGCTISNSAMHGVHCGTTFSGALVLSNTMTGNGTSGSGVFWCQNVTNLIVHGNTISTFNHGCSDAEFGSSAQYSLIRQNTFTNIAGDVFCFTRGACCSMFVVGNTINGLKGDLFNCGNNSHELVIVNNEVKSISSSATSSTMGKLVNVAGSTNAIITGNTLASGVSLPSGTVPVDDTNATNVINNNNSWN